MWLIWLMACGGSGAQLPTATARGGTFEASMSVLGELQAVNDTTITSPQFKGRPEISWLARQGQRVKKGDKVVEFDRENLIQSLIQAENELELARTKILQNRSKLELAVGEASASIRRAELDLELASMRRTDSDTVPLVEREEARISQTKSEMAIDAARSNLDGVKLESRADTRLLELEVERKTRRVEELQEQIEKAVITAPTDGVVLVQESWDGLWKVGSRPWRGAKLISLPDLSEMKVEAEVHEIDAPRVALGQKARVVVDALPGVVVPAEVTKVAELAVAKGEYDIKYLDIEVQLAENRPEFLPGLSARVEVVVDEVPGAVWVPIEAVFTDEDEASHVFVEGLTGFSTTPVERGIENDTHVVVTGIEAGTVVALRDPTAEDDALPAAQTDGS